MVITVSPLTIEELIKILQQMPPKALVKRMMTAEYGTIEIENIRLINVNLVVID